MHIQENNTFTETKNKVVTYTINGPVSPIQIAEATHLIEAASLENHSHVNVCLDIQHFDGWSNAGALLKEVKDRASVIKKIDKVAVVTHKEWASKIEGAANVISPGIELKIFKPEEKQTALQWLAGSTTACEKSAVSDDDIISVNEFDTGNSQIVGFSLNGGKLSKADYVFIDNKLTMQEAATQHLNIYFEMLRIDGITIQGILEGIKTNVKHYTAINKVAFVSHINLATVIEVSNFLTPNVTIKFFKPEEAPQALHWLQDAGYLNETLA